MTGSVEFLQRIKDAGEAGYAAARNSEQRTIDALAARKLVKKGARNKETGKTPYLLTKAAASHLPAAAPPAPAPTAPVAAPAPAAAPPQAAAVAPRPRRPCETIGLRDHPVHAPFPPRERGVLRLDPDSRKGETHRLSRSCTARTRRETSITPRVTRIL